MNNVFLDKRILIAEDDGALAAMLAADVRELGFTEVRTEFSLAGALVAVREFRPAIALLDIVLTDGISLRVAEVLAGSGIPSVFMTGDAGADAAHGLAVGSVLLKPFSPTQLQEALIAGLTKH